MKYLSILRAPLRNIFWSNDNTLFKQTLYILFGICALAFAAQLSIPFIPIPLTFQSTTVVLIGMAYGPRYGSYTVAGYLIAGMLGLPIFANFSSGILVGPTLGYLLGFLPAAFVAGYLAASGLAKNRATCLIAATLATSIIFASGVSVLALYVGWHNAIAWGLMPFLLSELIKLLALASVAPRFWKSS